VTVNELLGEPLGFRIGRAGLPIAIFWPVTVGEIGKRQIVPVPGYCPRPLPIPRRSFGFSRRAPFGGGAFSRFTLGS